ERERRDERRRQPVLPSRRPGLDHLLRCLPARRRPASHRIPRGGPRGPLGTDPIPGRRGGHDTAHDRRGGFGTGGVQWLVRLERDRLPERDRCPERAREPFLPDRQWLVAALLWPVPPS